MSGRRPLRILYFAPVFPPEQSGGATHVYELAREWVGLGHRVTVAKGFPSHPHGRVPPEYRWKLIARNGMDGIDLLYTWSYATPNVGFFRRTLGYLSSAFFPLLANLCLRRRYDVVIGTCPHIFLVAAAFVMSVLTGAHFVFEVRDPWPRQIADLGLLRNRAAIRLLEAFELLLYRRARLVVAVTRGVRDSIIARGIDARKVAYVPNGVDCALFRPLDRARRRKARRDLGLEGKFIAGYFGTFGLSQGLGVIIDAAEILRGEGEGDVVFLLAGDGAERGALVERKKRSRLENVIILPPRPRERMPELYAASDAGIVPLRKVGLFRNTVPSKLFELMACGVPVVLGVLGEARELLERAGAGVSVEPEDAEALARAVLRVRASHELRARASKAGVEFVRAHRDRRALARRFASALEILSGSR